MVSKLLLITVVGRLRVIVCPDAEVIISLVVPAIVNDCEVLTVPVPLSPAIPISIPVSAEPSMAGKVPVRFAAGILPDPVILFPLRSKLPPSCGDVSVTRSAEMRTVAMPAAPVVAVTVTP